MHRIIRIFWLIVLLLWLVVVAVPAPAKADHDYEKCDAQSKIVLGIAQGRDRGIPEAEFINYFSRDSHRLSRVEYNSLLRVLSGVYANTQYNPKQLRSMYFEKCNFHDDD